MKEFTATIAAISTPPGKGGVALIRVSGEDAITICSRCFAPKNKRPLTEQPARYAIYGDILHEGTVIDDGIATIFTAPASYTGEDTVEITCHGGILITQLVLESLFAAGARPASPGEFTKRAFISGKLDLTQAEAVAGLLEAESREQISLSVAQTRGVLSKEISTLYENLRHTVSAIYAKIDFPDEDLSEIGPQELYDIVQKLCDSIDELCKTYKTGRAIYEGISTVICGRPNTGKSSLYNAIAGEELAIVTDFAGTTRDLLSANIPFGRVMLRLFDTAGIRQTDEPIEKIGIERAISKISQAELILAVFDGSNPLTDEDLSLINQLKKATGKVIALVNKSDLPCLADLSLLDKTFDFVIRISCLEGRGIEDLQRCVNRLFTDEALSTRQDAIVTNARQYASLVRALDYAKGALSALSSGLAVDVACADLEGALAALAELDGRAVSEDIVNEIFSRFCVGK
ncbi:MAG: tRNA uridine-5-carboxymethylaminomethyl(34) synthesis GTPase MnmE [Clostridiales bacterium]|nr:tRNA uridine-5-carboxymethylaminomethyl(34) synthesis GTPase MnmE [Clostridiales bacterium]